MAADALHDAAVMGAIWGSMFVESQGGPVGDVSMCHGGLRPSSQRYAHSSGAGTFLRACSFRRALQPQAKKGQWDLLHACTCRCPPGVDRQCQG